LLNSTIEEDNLLFVVNLTNPDVYRAGQLLLPRGTLHITRTNLFTEYHLPELFGGFYRRKGAGPVPYPTACSPQAWGAASVFLLLQSILGMNVSAATSRLAFVQPVLPNFLDTVRINNLSVGAASVDLLISRRAQMLRWKSNGVKGTSN